MTRRRRLSKCRPRGISAIRHLLSFGDRFLRKQNVDAPLPTHAFTDPAALGLQRLDFTSIKSGPKLAETSHQIGIKSGPQLAIHETNVVPAAPRRIYATRAEYLRRTNPRKRPRNTRASGNKSARTALRAARRTNERRRARMSPLPSLTFLNHVCHHLAGAVAENFPNPRTHPQPYHSERRNVLEDPGTPRSRKLSFLAAGTREPNSH